MENDRNETLKQYVIFTLEGEEYGLNTTRVEGIEKITPITRIPNAPKCIRGIVNIRGEILPIVDLRVIFEEGVTNLTSKSQVIILAIEDYYVGILVDEVNDIMPIGDTCIENVDKFAITYEGKLTCVESIGKVHKRIIMLIEVEKLICNIKV